MNIALVLSGGAGSRVGGPRPKQYIEAGGRPAVGWCLEAFGRHREIGAVQVVADRQWHPYIRAYAGEKLRGFSRPGASRQESILNGLEDIMAYAGPDSLVVVHDGARPFVSEGLVSRCLAACALHDGAMPGLPVKDTVYVREGDAVAQLLDRGRLCAGQTPEAYRLGMYWEACRRLSPGQLGRIDGSTQAAILAGMDIAVVEGDEANFKITTARDLEEFMRIAGQEG